MVNPFREIDWNPTLAKRREFGRVLLIGFVIIGGSLFIAHLLGFLALRKGILTGVCVGAALGALSWMLPQFARPLYVLWYSIGACIGIVTSNLLLAATYYLVLTPFALIFRLIGRDPLRRRFDPQAATYWEPAERDVDPGRYFRQF